MLTQEQWKHKQLVKAEALRENHAARTIQHGWRSHHRHRQQREMDDVGLDASPWNAVQT